SAAGVYWPCRVAGWLYQTDVALGSGHGLSPELVVGKETGERFRKAKLRGVRLDNNTLKLPPPVKPPEKTPVGRLRRLYRALRFAISEPLRKYGKARPSDA